MAFEPSAHEKLSSKFILDGLKKRSVAQEPLPEAEPELDLAPVTDTPVVAVQETLPELELNESETENEPDFSGKIPPGKKYFRIGEVSDIVGVEAYVLRYWESEFKIVKPVKSRSGQRVYLRKDVESLLYIRHLLHFEKFSIKGAKKKIQERRREKAQLGPQAPSAVKRESLKLYAAELKELLKLARMDPGL